MLLILTLSVQAQNNNDLISRLDSLQRLNEVTIVANRYQEVIPSQKLSGDELKRLNAHSVADAIRYFSGVQIKDYGGIGGIKTVDIRSMGSHHMGVFYDGIQLGNAQNGQIDLGKFSLDNIEEISLFNGQKSEIFQPAKDYGSAGSIYLRTRIPQFLGNKKTNLRGIFRTGSFGLVNPSVLWEQKITPAINFSYNIEYTYAHGKYKFRNRKVNPDGSVAWDTTATRQNGQIYALRQEGSLHGYINQGKWNAKAYYYISGKGIPGAIVNNVWENAAKQWDQNFFAQTHFQKDFNKYSLMVNAKYAHDYMHFQNFDTAASPFHHEKILKEVIETDSSWILQSKGIDNYFWQKEFYISVANRYSIFPNWDVSLSSDYQWNSLDASLKEFVYPRRNTALIAAATAFEWKRIKAMASFLGTFVKDNISRNPNDNSKTAPSKEEYTPAAFLTYQPFDSKNFLIRSFYKKIFRMPTFNDLYYTDIGNIHLRPEYTVQYNLGALYTKKLNNLLKDINIKADIYYNEVTDKIVAVPKGNSQYRWMMMNIGKVKIKGLDISCTGNWNLFKDLFIRTHINYTYQKAQDYSDPSDNGDGGSYKGQIAYIPWHSGSAIIGGMYKDWDFNYSFIYVGERYDNSSNIIENYLQPWYTSDLSVGRLFSYKKTEYKITLEVNNILNQSYEVVRNYPMPGRNFKVILRATL
ncbi:MAG: TonB-dependent receptor plug domain-containing protein [Bacteroidales bacterium]|nr:TonB-dependent receptor plug domain-containing protein [Bacteroidales bacterium]